MVGSKMKYPLVSIIMTSLNGMKWLEIFFESILKTTYQNFELIYVDGGSTDSSLEFIKERYGKDRRIKIFVAGGTGWSGGNNFGIKKSKGDILVLISNDIEVEPDWLEELVEIFNKDPLVGIIQCNVHRLYNKDLSDSGLNYLDRFGYSYGFQPKNKPTEVFFAEGMAFAFRRKLTNDIGLLDEFYFMEYDDMDYSWRARIAGYKVVLAPKSIVYHAGGGTVGASYFERRPKNVRQYTRNHLISLLKNYELKNVIINFPIAFFIEFTKVFYFLLNKNFIFAKAVSKGIFEVFVNIHYILKERQKVQNTRVVSDAIIMTSMVSFNPIFLFSFLAKEKKKERFMILMEPPVIGGIKYVKD